MPDTRDYQQVSRSTPTRDSIALLPTISPSSAEYGHEVDRDSSSPELIPSHASSRTPSRYTTPLPGNPQPPQPRSSNLKNSVSNTPGEQDPDQEAESLVSDEDEDDEWIDGDDPTTGMPSNLRPPYRRPSEGKSYTPLLNDADSPNNKHENTYDSAAGPGLGGGPRPDATRRRSSMRHSNPEEDAKRATRKRYVYAAVFLSISLVSFTVQTETAVYIQHTLKWNKAYAMLYFTHGSWTSLWFLQLLFLRIQKWNMPWRPFWRRHVQLLRETALMVKYQDVHAPNTHAHDNPWPWIIRTSACIACALTVAGGSWYVAVDLTTASDLTAIYNCSAFFAYVFSVPLLHERVRVSKVVAVLVAIAGVLIVAYGDVKPSKHGSHSGGGAGGDNSPEASQASHRSLGNLVIGVGSILYGLYEVLYKRFMCPPDGTSPGRSMIFANLVGSLLGGFTLLVLWIPIPILNLLGWEPFALPRGEAAWLLLISTFSNAIFSGSFLVLISLTSPVLSSVAALLTIFLVALVDQLLPPPFGSPLTVAAIIGGCLIIGAFLLLSWATYIEVGEERRKKEEAGAVEESGSESDVEDGGGNNRLLTSHE